MDGQIIKPVECAQCCLGNLCRHVGIKIIIYFGIISTFRWSSVRDVLECTIKGQLLGNLFCTDGSFITELVCCPIQYAVHHFGPFECCRQLE